MGKSTGSKYDVASKCSANEQNNESSLLFTDIFLRHYHVKSFNKGNQAELHSGIQGSNDPLFGQLTEMWLMGLLHRMISSWSLHECIFLVKGKISLLIT